MKNSFGKWLAAFVVVILIVLTVIVLSAALMGLITITAALAMHEAVPLIILLNAWVTYTIGMTVGVVGVLGSLAAATLLFWPIWRELPAPAD